MFYALPAETVFEAKERNRRATFFLLGSLIFLYVFFFDLLVLVFDFWLLMTSRILPSVVAGILVWSSALAFLAALLHFAVVRGRPLNAMLLQIGAVDADPADQLHLTFIHVVAEAAAAIGAPAIRAVVLSAPGLNAFSMEDGKGQKAIGITEGLLAKLNRSELSAVVAHEAAHILHEDSRLVTTACFLFGLFGVFQAFLGNFLSLGFGRAGSSSRKSAGGPFFVAVLWLISSAGYFATKLIFMAVSREREYLADADGAQMCKDPLALAESLYKISNRYRGGLPATFSALFIVNPQDSVWDEGEDWFSNLFSTHPPMGKRLKKLLDWAKSDLASLQAMDAREEKSAAAPGGSVPVPADTFMAYQNGQWSGPFTPEQMFSSGLLIPSNWICPAGSQDVVQVSQNPLLLSFLQASSAPQGGTEGPACPRCKVPLAGADYAGAEILKCGFCKGTLLREGVLERLISRESISFAPEAVQKAQSWRNAQKGTIAQRDHFASITCPYCQNHMGKFVHSYLTQVIIDRCVAGGCGAVWCDGGELETIQMLIAGAHSQTT